MSIVVTRHKRLKMFSGTYAECVEWMSKSIKQKQAFENYDIIPDYSEWAKEREKIVG